MRQAPTGFRIQLGLPNVDLRGAGGAGRALGTAESLLKTAAGMGIAKR